jgi:hypothetical protein
MQLSAVVLIFWIRQSARPSAVLGEGCVAGVEDVQVVVTVVGRWRGTEFDQR